MCRLTSCTPELFSPPDPSRSEWPVTAAATAAVGAAGKAGGGGFCGGAEAARCEGEGTPEDG